jgi:hypothetical protein
MKLIEAANGHWWSIRGQVPQVLECVLVQNVKIGCRKRRRRGKPLRKGRESDERKRRGKDAGPSV